MQIYAQYPDRKELKGFQRVPLKPGETRTLQIPIHLAGHPLRLLAGGSSADVRTGLAIK
jgi:hypothetical protein